MQISQKTEVCPLLLMLLVGLSLGASANAPVSKPVNTPISNLTISLNVYPGGVVRGGIIAFELNVSDRRHLAILPPPTVCSASDPKCFGKVSRYCSMMPVRNSSSSYYCVYSSLRNSPGNYTVVASVKDRSGRVITSMPVNFSIVSKSRANLTNAARTEFPVTTAYATLVRLYSKKPVQNSSAGNA